MWSTESFFRQYFKKSMDGILSDGRGLFYCSACCAVRRGGMLFETIDEDMAVVQPTR
jgi:hypothetical protein